MRIAYIAIFFLAVFLFSFTKHINIFASVISLSSFASFYVFHYLLDSQNSWNSLTSSKVSNFAIKNLLPIAPLKMSG